MNSLAQRAYPLPPPAHEAGITGRAALILGQLNQIVDNAKTIEARVLAPAPAPANTLVTSTLPNPDHIVFILTDLEGRVNELGDVIARINSAL